MRIKGRVWRQSTGGWWAECVTPDDLAPHGFSTRREARDWLKQRKAELAAAQAERERQEEAAGIAAEAARDEELARADESFPGGLQGAKE